MEGYWRKIKGFDNYMVSFDGEIKSLKRKGVINDRIVKPWLNGGEYYVYLYDDKGVRHAIIVRKIVAESFLNYSGDVTNISRIVNIPSNNSATNLVIKYESTKSEILMNTPVDILVNFSSAYLSKSYGIKKSLVEDIMNKKLEGYKKYIKVLETAKEYDITNEFNEYYEKQSPFIDGSWVNSQERRFIKNNLYN